MKNPNRPLRRCKCHKVGINVERDYDGTVLSRRCMVTLMLIGKGQTYLASYGSDAEYTGVPDQTQEQRRDLSE